MSDVPHTAGRRNESVNESEGCRSEETISRILCAGRLAMPRAAIIYLR